MWLIKKAITKIQAEVKEIMEESNDLIQQEQMKKEQQKSTKLPWQGLRAINSSQNGNMTDIIKDEILALSDSKDNFLIEDENYMYQFDFEFDDYIEQAIKVQENDEKLALLRKILVPKRISDEKFWKNYFYNVEIIKLKYNMENKIVQIQKKQFQQINMDNQLMNQNTEEQKLIEQNNSDQQDQQQDNQENLIIRPEEDDEEGENNKQSNNQQVGQFIEMTNQNVQPQQELENPPQTIIDNANNVDKLVIESKDNEEEVIRLVENQ